ncbi:MAG: hypothetical protein ACMXX6_00415 [Candidatus Woesearchaeota archaeon]
MKQKEPSKFLKGSLFTLLAGAGTVNYVKNLIFGKPPSKARKAVFWSFLGATILYNSCSDQISTGYNDLMDHVNDSRIEKIRSLKHANSEYENTLQAYLSDIDKVKNEYSIAIKDLRSTNSSVIDENRNLSRRLNNLQNQNSNLELKIERLNNKISLNNAQSSNNSNQNREQSYASVTAQSSVESTSSPSLQANYWYVAKEGQTLREIAKYVTGSSSNKNIIRQVNGITFDKFLEGYPVKIPDNLAFNKNSLRTEEIPDFVKIDLRSGVYNAIRNSVPGFANVSLPQRDPRARSIVDYNLSLGNNGFNKRGFNMPRRMILYVPDNY